MQNSKVSTKGSGIAKGSKFARKQIDKVLLDKDKDIVCLRKQC